MKKIIRILLCIILLLSALPIIHTKHIDAKTNENTYIVSASVLNLREGPGLTFPVLKELKKNDRLTYIEKKGEWVKVTVGETEGWVASWLVKSETTVQGPSKHVVSKVDHLNVRKEPSLNASVMTQLFSGDKATYIQQSDEWIQIKYNDSTGWVNENYVSIIEHQHTNENSTNNEPSTSATIKGSYFTVNVSAVNIRSKADLNSKKLGTIKLNEQYEVLNKNGNWIEIEYAKNKKGWVYSFYGTLSEKKVEKTPTTEQQVTQKKVQILYDGTNLRLEPNTNAKVVKRAKIGESFNVLSSQNDWYEIQVGADKAYVANWVVKDLQQQANSTFENKETTKEKRKKGTLKGLTIVIDPGHGGNDHGTTGVSGTPEKTLNIKTAELLTNKLRSAGAEVVLTRESDKYVDLRKRVSISNQYDADAFISIHYDASDISSVKGFTTYYTNSNQKALAEAVHKGIGSKITLRDRGAQPGNYLVLRENSKPSILLELGYLSNRDEERIVTTDYFREQATQGIYEGLLNYFDDQLN